MKIVGLTGGIATGKSTVSALLAEQGLHVVDADKIAKAIVQKGRWGYKRVVKTFGTDILQADGEIDRKKLGKLIFENPDLRRQLNAATHPIVSLELARQILWHWLLFHFVVVVDVPLLFEGGLNRYASLTMTVACNPETQRRRLMARDQSDRDSAQSRINSQMPLEQKTALSDIVLDNSGSLDELSSKVKAVAAALKTDMTFRGLLSSPLAIVIAALTLATVLRRSFERRWPTLSRP